MNINITKISSSIGSFWMRYYRLVFFIFFLTACGVGAYVWYESIYGSGWTDEQKKEYNKKRVQEVRFESDEFDWLLGRTREKKEMGKKEASQLTDIFKLEK